MQLKCPFGHFLVPAIEHGCDAGHRVYLFGAKGREADELRKWAERNPSLTVVAGTMSLKEEIEAETHGFFLS